MDLIERSPIKDETVRKKVEKKVEKKVGWKRLSNS